MKDTGLIQAIEAVGGVGALARGLGISQPSVSGWSRIPADRVLAVEALTNVPRSILRSDLFGGDSAGAAPMPEIDEIDRLRAAEWGMLAVLMGRAPDADTLEKIGARAVAAPALPWNRGLSCLPLVRQRCAGVPDTLGLLRRAS